MTEQKHDPNAIEQALIKAFPFLAAVMGYSTERLMYLNEIRPKKAKRIAHNQQAVDKSKEQSKKAKLS